MSLLTAGLLIFTIAHLMPAASPATRAQLAAKLGENAYRGIFSVVIVASLVPHILFSLFIWALSRLVFRT